MVGYLASMPAPLITLTTDLGENEPYVATIKGALFSRCPEARVIDLGHQLSAFHVLDGALFTAGALPHFPPGTIHLVAVAPGADPRAIAVQVNEQIVICPDNGMITLLDRHHGIEAARQIEIEHDPGNPYEHIFFARDVLAPIAADLAQGKSFEELGVPIENLERLEWPTPVLRESNRLEAKIMHVDRFGNLVTNLHHSDLTGKKVERIQSGDFSISKISRSYYDVAEQKPLVLFGHGGYLELAFSRDRACDRLDLDVGIYVSVYLEQDPD